MKLVSWRVLDGRNRPLGVVFGDSEGFALQIAVRQFGEDVARLVPLAEPEPTPDPRPALTTENVFPAAGPGEL